MPIDASNQASYVQNLLYGWSWTGNSEQAATITYTFDSDQATLNDLRGSSAASNEADIIGTSLQQAFLSAATIWSSYANINFSPNDTPSEHHLVFGYADLPASQTDPDGNPITPAAIPYFNLQPLAGQGSTYFAAGEMNAGELLVSSNYTSFAVGSQAYYEVMHEMGHMLGLAHPFATNQFDHATYMNGHTTTDLAGYPYDTWDNSIMSYNLASQGSAVHSSSVNRPVTPMIYDIAAIQFLYGAKSTTHSGNTGYDLTNMGVTDHVSTLWDAGGEDTISAGATQNAAVIDLREGFHPNGTQYYSKVDNTVLFNAFGANIENAIGSEQADQIYGNDSYEAGHYAHLAELSFHGQNVLRGLGGDDTIYGGSGDDTLEGGADADAMHGGTGFDWLSYENAASSIKVKVTNWDTGSGGFSGEGFASGAGEAQGDTFTGIEGIIGTKYNDEIDLSAIGIVNGELPNILLDLGAGHDVISWANYQTDVSITFSSLSGVDQVTGSSQNDTFNGQALNSALIFKGEGGADILSGGSGDDTLYGGAGNDVLIGNAGSDLYRIFEGEGQDTIIDSDRNGEIRYGADNIWIAGATYVASGQWERSGGDGPTYHLTLSGNDLIISDPAYAGSSTRIQGFVASGTEAWANHLGVLRLERPDDFGDVNDDAINVSYSSYFSGEGENGTLTGSEGNDLLDGLGGASKFDGGSGNDTVTFANAPGTAISLASSNFISIENLVGSVGEDNLTGNAADNILWGAGGDDRLSGMSGNDALYGGAGSDTLFGGDGDDVMNGGTGNDFVTYEGHSQAVDVDLGNGTASGAGNDTLISIEQVIGTSFDDDITGGLENESLSGGSGNDTISGGFGHDTLIGGTGSDYLEGNDGNDSLIGGDGFNTLSGGAGDDTLIVINFGQTTTGDNTLYGGAGNDGLFGGNRHDVLDGGSGNDNLHGNEGSDTLSGGAGNDLLWGDQTGEISSGGNDVLYGEEGNDTLNGSAGADTLDGGAGDDYLKGNGSGELIDTVANLLIGGSGNDTLEAGQSGDTLDGGLGDDLLIGRNGADTFVIGQDSGASDTIYSFSLSNDLIDLRAFVNITSMGQLLSSNENGAVITLGDNQSVTLAGISFTSLSVSNFIFAHALQNTAPLAVGDFYSLDDGTTLTVTAQNSVLLNDSDMDNDALSAVLVSDVSFGTLTFNADGTFSYTHDGSENFSDSFSYKVNDATDDSNIVTVSLSITPVENPVIQGPFYGTSSADAFIIQQQDMVSIDIFDFNPENDQIELVGMPEGFSFGETERSTVNGNAVVQLGMGQSLVFYGLSHTQLSSGNFVISDGGDPEEPQGPFFGSEGQDTFTIQQQDSATIHIYSFDPSEDFVQLLGMDPGFSFGETERSTLEGNAFVQLGLGQTLVFHGISHTALTAENFIIGENNEENALYGSEGQDVFVIAPEANATTNVYNFTAGDDKFDLSAFSYITSMDDLSFYYDGSAAVVLVGNAQMIRIMFIPVEFLSASNFIFAADSNVIEGTSGNDTLTGTADAEVLDGLAGNDIINAGSGDDTLIGGLGADVLKGESGADVYRIADKTHSTASGTDIILGFGQGSDKIDLSGLGFSDLVAGQANAEGTTLAYWTQFGDTFVGNADGSFRLRIDGEFTLTREDLIGVGPDYAFTHAGATGNDSLVGGSGADAFNGGKGQDVMRGKGGNDIYFFDHLEDSKDSSPDTILEWDNSDVIDVSYLGFTGIQAGSANGSTLGWAVAGNYTEIFDSGKFLIRIHNGTAIETPAITADNFIFSDGPSFTDENYTGTSGADIYVTGLGNDVLYGNDGDDVLTGGGGHDTIDGGAGNDTLYGGDGDDTLFGQGGYDRLEAGAGHDRLIAGVNKDWLVGGSGNDTFSFFSDSHSSEVQPDTIADFVQGEDVIDLDTLTYTGIQSGAASGTVLGFTYQQNTSAQNITVVEADTGTFEIILMGHVSLTNSDFVF